MFACKNCKSIDKFELMFAPDYKGSKEFKWEYNNNEDIVITVIATGFEEEEKAKLGTIPVTKIVDKAWEQKINSVATTPENNNQVNDLDIPSFLRKNKATNK